MKNNLALIATLSLCFTSFFCVEAKQSFPEDSTSIPDKTKVIEIDFGKDVPNLRALKDSSHHQRYLQEDDTPLFRFRQFLEVAANGASTVIGSFGIVIENFVEMGIEIVELISDEGLSILGIINIVGEAIVETAVELVASIASFLVEDFTFLLRNNIEEALKDYDPYDLIEEAGSTLNATNFTIISDNNCTIVFNLTAFIVRGLSSVNFDTFEINDFSYRNNMIDFTWDFQVSVPEFDLDFKGFIESSNMCAGGAVEYSAETSFGLVGLGIGVTVEGNVTNDGSQLVVTSANFSRFGLTGLDTSETILSDISPYDENIRNELLKMFLMLVDTVFGDLSSAIPGPENFLEDAGISLPVTFDLPVPFPI